MVNKIVQQFNWKYFEPIKDWKVKSRTNFNPDINEFDEYTVELWMNGKIYCSCLWGQKGNLKRPCWHVNRKREELEKEFSTVEKAIEHYKLIKLK